MVKATIENMEKLALHVMENMDEKEMEKFVFDKVLDYYIGDESAFYDEWDIEFGEDSDDN